jgi:hypothetical protein
MLHPLMACTCTDREIETLDHTLSKAKCHTLGLNEHFPQVILHGPLYLSGMGVHTAQTKTTTTCIAYFLYHTRLNTETWKKLETSSAYLQLNVVTIQPFLQMPSHIYRNIATTL